MVLRYLKDMHDLTKTIKSVKFTGLPLNNSEARLSATNAARIDLDRVRFDLEANF